MWDPMRTADNISAHNGGGDAGERSPAAAEGHGAAAARAGVPAPPAGATAECAAWAERGFCCLGPDCARDHPPARARAEPPLGVLLAELAQMGGEHAAGRYRCRVCAVPGGVAASPPTLGACETGLRRIGVTGKYRYCRRCGDFLFYPHLQLALLALVRRSGADYARYKRSVDAEAALLPDILHVPWYYQAHRWGSSRYSWSLAGAPDAKEALQILFHCAPQLRSLVSVGAGSGWTEASFLRAARELRRGLSVRAFDTRPRPAPHQQLVTHEVGVEHGGPERLRGLGDMSCAVLLLCWPPLGTEAGEQTTMAYDALTLFAELGGWWHVYIGDPSVTGDWRYHDLLASHWRIPPRCFEFPPLDKWLPEKMGLVDAGGDALVVYVRRDDPVPLAHPSTRGVGRHPLRRQRCCSS